MRVTRGKKSVSRRKVERSERKENQMHIFNEHQMTECMVSAGRLCTCWLPVVKCAFRINMKKKKYRTQNYCKGTEAKARGVKGAFQ